MRALDRLAAAACSTFLPVAIVAGERDHGDLRVVDQRVADGLAAADDDVDDAFGKDLGDDLGELQRGQRRLLGRLEDDGVAAGERRARASRPPSSADSSTARSSRRRRSDRGGSSRCGPARYSPATAPCMVRTAPAKKRKQSTIAGISSLQHARCCGLPQFSASSAAKASASRLDAVGELQQQRRALGRRGARPGLRRPSRAAATAASTCAGEASGSLTMVSSVFGLRTLLGASVPVDEFRADQHLRVEHAVSSTARGCRLFR